MGASEQAEVRRAIPLGSASRMSSERLAPVGHSTCRAAAPQCPPRSSQRCAPLPPSALSMVVQRRTACRALCTVQYRQRAQHSIANPLRAGNSLQISRAWSVRPVSLPLPCATGASAVRWVPCRGRARSPPSPPLPLLRAEGGGGSTSGLLRFVRTRGLGEGVLAGRRARAPLAPRYDWVGSATTASV